MSDKRDDIIELSATERRRERKRIAQAAVRRRTVRRLEKEGHVVVERQDGLLCVRLTAAAGP
jgi:hypothetical protein